MAFGIHNRGILVLAIFLMPILAIAIPVAFYRRQNISKKISEKPVSRQPEEVQKSHSPEKHVYEYVYDITHPKHPDHNKQQFAASHGGSKYGS